MINFGNLAQSQQAGINSIREECTRFGCDRGQTAYILATAWHETGGRMQPVREGFAASDAGARQAVANWAAKNKKRNYAAPDPETGQSYYGRGLVQITHRVNYLKLGLRLCIDLETNPDLALSPGIAERILVLGMMAGDFTGRKLSEHVEGERMDFVGARKVVNGTDRAELIASYAKDFYAWLKPPAKPEPVAETPRAGLIVLAVAALVAGAVWLWRRIRR